MRDQFIKKLSELALKDPRIVLITGDLGFRVLDNYIKDFPNQFINAGVSEQNMTLLATGMALEGHIVFTYSIANFPILRCLEQIRNDACYHNANVKIVSIGGGFSYGALGISHHATEDLAIMRSLPNITVVSPCGYWETMEATEAIVKIKGTCYLRLDKSAGADKPHNDNEIFQIGKARKIREGSDCTIIVTGGILEEVLLAYETLTSEGISTRILNMHTIKPIDESAIMTACAETGAIITVEEHTVYGGLGGSVAEVLMYSNTVPKKFLCIGLEAGFSSIVGSQTYLRQHYRLDASSIAERVRSLLKG